MWSIAMNCIAYKQNNPVPTSLPPYKTGFINKGCVCHSVGV